MHPILYASVVAVTILATSPAAMAETRSCEPVTKEKIAALFDRWNASLQTKNPDEVVKNYAHNAMLLPTLSNKMRTTPEAIKDYFVHFLEKSPVGTINDRVIHIGCNEAWDAGNYTFTLTDAEGKKSDFPARYTYTYALRDGTWLITHHHSSAMPEKAGAKAH